MKESIIVQFLRPVPWKEWNLLDYPTYTKPRVYEGMEVPEVLVSGDHKKIAEYRKQEQIKKTSTNIKKNFFIIKIN